MRPSSVVSFQKPGLTTQLPLLEYWQTWRTSFNTSFRGVLVTVQVAVNQTGRKSKESIDPQKAEAAALKCVLEQKAAYDGPNREEYVAELDRFIEEFRKKHGPQIPVAEAYAILKEIEARFGRVE
jgi:hypothetical protein